MHILKLVILLIISAVALCSAVGCSTLGYYSQSIRGHLSLLSKREPVSELLQDKSLDASRRKQLEMARAIRDYASETLKLPDNGSYRQYVALDQPYVVWNVVATPELSLDPVKWCFPVVGCLSYRGYYAKEAAEKFAQPLRDQGYDVMVRGVRAYSTLGWFDDPLVSTMFRNGPNALAEVISHELSHQIIYAKNDTIFNEAFASTVGELGVKHWIQSRHPEKLEDYLDALKRRDQFLDLLRNTSDHLRTLYASASNDDSKRQQKAAIIEALRDNYQKLKTSWDGYEGYDGWFKTPINNARLISIAVYRDRVPDFMRWFEACGEDFDRFYSAVKTMGKLDQTARHKRLTGPAECST